MMVAGLGCRRNVTTVDVLAAIDATLAKHTLARPSLDALATVPLKREEPALQEAASALGLPLLLPTADAIAAAAPATLTYSAASLAATGTPSASESAALAAAGAGARLLGRRFVLGAVTCAIAVREETP